MTAIKPPSDGKKRAYRQPPDNNSILRPPLIIPAGRKTDYSKVKWNSEVACVKMHFSIPRIYLDKQAAEKHENTLASNCQKFPDKQDRLSIVHSVGGGGPLPPPDAAWYSKRADTGVCTPFRLSSLNPVFCETQDFNLITERPSCIHFSAWRYHTRLNNGFNRDALKMS